MTYYPNRCFVSSQSQAIGLGTVDVPSRLARNTTLVALRCVAFCFVALPVAILCCGGRIRDAASVAFFWYGTQKAQNQIGWFLYLCYSSPDEDATVVVTDPEEEGAPAPADAPASLPLPAAATTDALAVVG
mmetsp:Transcript_6343/g.18087  ORF Transcript_6343/g.18087 Transcript_6343/m.18087 type:complete len:131 (-) Transcript_6343:1766-2158(-)